MIVCPMFPGDCNKTLMKVQHELYLSLLPYLYGCARERYLKAAHLVGVETELFQLIKDKHGFDHRVLQHAHDHIAAFYRFKLDDGGQIPLGTGPEQYDELLRQRWSEFVRAEAQALAGTDPIALAILGAVAYENTEKGGSSEALLAELLTERYGKFPREVVNAGLIE